MPVNAEDDSAVVREVLSGRTEAFRVLVERYFATVRLVALAKTGNAADAEDVAQDTFIKAYETLGVLRDRNRLAPWLVAIARNLAITLVRRRERERRSAEGMPMEARVYPDHEKRELLDAVARQVEALPENLREVVLLHYFEGLKCREIADRLDMNTNAVVKRLARGREVLGDRLLREWGEGGQRQAAGGRIQQVMGAIVALPRPDWGAQLAASGAGGVGAATKLWMLGPLVIASPVALKLSALASSIIALGILYIALNTRGGEDDLPVATGRSAPAADEGLIAAVASGVGEQWKRAFAEEEDGPVWVAIEPLPPPPPRREVGFVAGTVVDEDGRPVGGAEIRTVGFYESAPAEPNGKGVTNPAGAFRVNLSAPVPNIESGKYNKSVTISCDAPGYVNRIVPEVRLGTADVRVVLLRPAVVTGTVVDAGTGKPVTQFSLRIDRRSPRNPETGEPRIIRWQATYSATGEFRLEAPYGFTSFDAIATGYVGTSIELPLAQGESHAGLVIALERGGEIRGFVFDKATEQPLPKASVQLISPVPPHLEPVPPREYGVKTKRDGSFTWTEAPLDTVATFYVSLRGYRREIVSVAPRESNEPVMVYLDKGGSVQGRVLYRGGPPPGCEQARAEDGYCSVMVHGSDVGYSDAHSNVRPDGTYEVSGLEDGVYLAVASFRSNGTGESGTSISKRVTVRNGKATRLDIDFDEPAGNIDLKVTGLEAVGRINLELRAAADPFVVCSRAVSPSAIYRPMSVNAENVPIEVGLPTLEPGEYVLWFYRPDGEEGALEEMVLVGAGQTVELNVDVGGLAGETAGEDTENDGEAERLGDGDELAEIPGS